MKGLFYIAIAALAAGGAPAAADTLVRTAPFDAVELRGGGHVTLRHGAEHRVTMTSGDALHTRLAVDHRGRLVIDACIRSCPDYRLEVEIVAPEIQSVAVQGGGSIETKGAFPARGSLAAAVRGGGSIDVAGIEAGDVAAAVNGGGQIRTHASRSLAATISGGGTVVYEGDPQVTSAINGGGSVAPARRR